MANSKLATYTHLATNKCNPRDAAISKITIHHMSGKLTGKQCADYFCAVSDPKSANYCIGYDGDIAVNVDENKRAWTSSSRWNDMRAVTIEVSNIANSASVDPEWKISDKAMAALISLCVDICRRNGIKELKYDGTTNGTLTRHCMYASTDCPGPYLKKKTSYICEQVNKALRSGEKTETPAAAPAKPKTEEKPKVKEVKASRGAEKYDKSIAGKYKVSAPAGLYLRDGAGTDFKALVLMPQNTVCSCYGYYTNNWGRWYYVIATVGGVTYTGFCAGNYLKRI